MAIAVEQFAIIRRGRLGPVLGARADLLLIEKLHDRGCFHQLANAGEVNRKLSRGWLSGRRQPRGDIGYFRHNHRKSKLCGDLAASESLPRREVRPARLRSEKR